MSNKKILQGHNKALESLVTIAGIPLTKGFDIDRLGFTKYAFDTFTPTSDTTEKTTINHSLGEIPTLTLIVPLTFLTSSSVYIMASLIAHSENSLIVTNYGSKDGVNVSSSGTQGSLTPKPTASQVTWTNTYNGGLRGGTTYAVLTLV